MHLHFKHLSIVVASVVLIGCGGGGSSSVSSAEELAIAKIAAYATGGSVAPTLDDYKKAGITISEDDLSQMNEYVLKTNSKNKEDWIVDTDGDGTIDGIDDYPNDPDKAENTPPVATSQNITLDEDSSKNITLSGTDEENKALNYGIRSHPSHGTLSGTAANYTYTPKKDYFGNDSFTFTVNDGMDDSSEAIVSLTIKNVNDKPIATAQDITVLYETQKPITLSGTDIDGDDLSYILSTSPSHGTLSGTAPILTYTPNNGYKGSDNFTFKVKDASVRSEAVTISLTVTDDQDAIHITNDYQVESLGKATSIHKNIYLGSTAKSLYILLSNYSKTNTASSSITHNAKVISVAKSKKLLSTSIVQDQPQVLHAPAHIQAYNSNVTALLQKSSNTEYQAKSIAVVSKSNKSVGESETFYMDDDSAGAKTTATLKKVVSNVSTDLGTKTLNIWVSNDSFDSGSGCDKSSCVTQNMVDELANNFLKVGKDNDIYDWVTNIYGEEWGNAASKKYSGFIAENNEITILLTDIPDNGVIGYFYSKDNVKKSVASGSNERIMFYADAVMFNDNKKEMYSTLAHEFQHMIHFYQKTVLLEASDDVWINEMLSETTEDLIATKIQHTGPRGVVYTDGSAGEPKNIKGRYPDFNENNTLSLTSWNNTLTDYSKVNAFGTFLIRNYGGAKVLHDIMDNKKEHEDSIEVATGKTFDTLLKEWGIAVLLSNNENLENTPFYNTGDFTPDTYKNSTYQLGSINFFNYDPKPTIEMTAGTVQPQGNYYYKIGDNLTGTVTIDLSLNGTTEATLIAK